MQVHVAATTLTSLPVDAIVNPANSRGIMGSGIAAQIKQAGGAGIQAAAMDAAPVAVGAAIVTEGGQLPAKHVIHAPIMAEPGERVAADNLRRAARAALIAAHASQFRVIAFPAIGTDTAGVAVEEAARAIVEELRSHRRAFPETVYLVATEASVIEAFEEALYNVQQNA